MAVPDRGLSMSMMDMTVRPNDPNASMPLAAASQMLDSMATNTSIGAVSMKPPMKSDTVCRASLSLPLAVSMKPTSV